MRYYWRLTTGLIGKQGERERVLQITPFADASHFLVTYVDDPIRRVGFIALERDVAAPVGLRRHDVDVPAFTRGAERGAIIEAETVLLLAEGKLDGGCGTRAPLQEAQTKFHSSVYN